VETVYRKKLRREIERKRAKKREEKLTFERDFVLRTDWACWSDQNALEQSMTEDSYTDHG
jgi:hypothetical protein